MTPVISVKKDIDGIYYWTVNGEWLIVDGNKVKAVGTDGANGENGTDGKDGGDGEDGIDGENGSDGKDGITPKFKIEDGYWYISYDNELSWKQLGKATGDNGLNGSDGESFFKGVSIENGYVCFILNDAESTVIKLPFVSETELSISIEPGTLKDNISDGQERTLLKLKLSGNVNEADIKYIRYYMTNLEYLDLSETQLAAIAPYAFEGMARLKEIILPQCCNNIGDNAFYGCRILLAVSAPGATISASAISSCENFERLECANINGGINNPINNNSYNQWTYDKIGVFEKLNSLKVINCYRRIPPACTQYAFNGLNEQFFYNCSLYVPKSSINDYKSDTYWGKFKNILPIEE